MAAQAADGCKFMLCMGAPNPMGIAECAPTIKEVLHDLSKGRPFPVCNMTDGRDSRTAGSYINHYRAPITPRCPSGTNQGRNGIFYHKGLMPTSLNNNRFFSNTRISGGSKNIQSESVFSFRSDDGYSQRVCLGGQKLGSYTTRSSSDMPSKSHEWWEDVQIMKPDGATWQFDFYVNNELHSSHRF